MQNNNVGFTLLEILIALFIFSIISIMMVSGLRSVISTQSGTEKTAEQLAELQVALTLLSRDVEQFVNRPIVNATGILEGSLMGSDQSVTLTHAGYDNPLGQSQRSTLQRTRYRLGNNELIRETWESLDQTTHTKINQRRLLAKVSNLHFQYLDNQGQFQENWHQKEETDLPRAIKVSLDVGKLGKISQLYVIPGRPIDKTSS